MNTRGLTRCALLLSPLLLLAAGHSSGTQDLGFLTFHRVTKQWVALAVDSSSNALASYLPAWEGARLALTAENVEIIGERVTLRQTITKVSNDEYVVLNEERLPGERWLALDEYRYRRAP